MMSPEHHSECLHEDQIQGQSRKIAELETRADYKEKMITDLNETLKDMKKSMDSLEKTINNFILKSINDDSALRDRITALETTNKTLKWVIGLGFTGLATVISILGFFISHLH